MSREQITVDVMPISLWQKGYPFHVSHCCVVEFVVVSCTTSRVYISSRFARNSEAKAS